MPHFACCSAAGLEVLTNAGLAKLADKPMIGSNFILRLACCMLQGWMASPMQA
jgi:hypothetical protein